MSDPVSPPSSPTPPSEPRQSSLHSAFPQPASPQQARSVLAGVLVATLLAALDLLAVAVALPEMALDLELERALALPVGAGVVGLVVAVPLAARLSRHGPRPVLLGAAAALVVAGGVATALAPLPTG
ncbi:hypothetical protein HLB09_17570, partial [Pseudokineococcus marinus]